MTAPDAAMAKSGAQGDSEARHPDTRPAPEPDARPLQSVRLSLERGRASLDAADVVQEVRAVARCVALVAPFGRVWTGIGRHVVEVSKKATASWLTDIFFRHLSVTLPGEPAYVVPLLADPSPSSRVGVLTIAAPHRDGAGLRLSCRADFPCADWREWVRELVKTLAPDVVKLVADRTWRFSVQREHTDAVAFESGWLQEQAIASEQTERALPLPVQVPSYLLEIAKQSNSEHLGRLLSMSPGANEEQADTREIDFSAVQRSVGSELPLGFAPRGAPEAVDADAATTLRAIPILKHEEAILHRVSRREAGGPTPDGQEGSGTVLAPPSREVLAARAAFGQKLTPVRVPELSVDRYAELVAGLELRGASDSMTLSHFGVFSEESRRALDELFRARFERSPVDGERFNAWLVHHRDRLRREGEER